MKEININIEGYNVNGICVGCLNYNRKMYSDSLINDCFYYMAAIDVPDGLTIQVCWECYGRIKSIHRFKKQILKAYDILIAYSQEHTFLNSPSDLTEYSSSFLTMKNIPEPDLEDNAPKLEIDLSVVKNENEHIKNELLDILNNDEDSIPAIFDDFSQDFSLDDPPANIGESSDDNIQLSKLKRKVKKEKKVRKGRQKKKKDKLEPQKDERRTLRKLKNLPPDHVELYKMTEEEMWSVRSNDVKDEDFLSAKHRCENCLTVFVTEKLLVDHFSKHEPKADVSNQCDVCKSYFIHKDNLTNHRLLHFDAYRCKICDKSTTSKRVILKHMETHTSKLGENFPCDLCDKVFSTNSRLIYHRGVHHGDRPQCDCCGKVFANKITLKHHLQSQVEKTENVLKEKVSIPCKGCDKVFHSKKSYRSHVVIHDGLTYPCPICGKLFQWKRNLARHTRNHRDRDAGAVHDCKLCGKSFASRDCYKNHLRLSKRHVPEHKYPHACSYCGKKFPTKYCMIDHVDWEHLRKIKYECSVCFKAFKTSKIMVAHVNNIHGGKNRRGEPDGQHLCEICGKSYKTVKRLKGHVWAMHTNRSSGKRYKCKHCPATFIWQTSVYKHAKMMHENGKRASRHPKPEKMILAIDQVFALKREESFAEGQDNALNRLGYPQAISNNFNLVQLAPHVDFKLNM